VTHDRHSNIICLEISEDPIDPNVINDVPGFKLDSAHFAHLQEHKPEVLLSVEVVVPQRYNADAYQPFATDDLEGVLVPRMPLHQITKVMKKKPVQNVTQKVLTPTNSI